MDPELNDQFGSPSDGVFCTSDIQWYSIGSCSAGWYGSTMPYRMSAGDCTHSTLWVRPSDIDGDGYSVEEDCDDNDVTVHDSCN